MWKARVHGDLKPAAGKAVRERRQPRRRGTKLGRVVVGEEEDAHDLQVKRAGTEGRIARVYAGYRADPRKRRAWDAQNRGNAAIREELAQAVLDLIPGVLENDGMLLDIGCGTGWWLERLAREGVAVERLAGVELLAERVRAARERVPGARIERADSTSLPFTDGSCSLVNLFTVLSSMSSSAEVRATLSEASRVLAPGGAVAVWEPRWPTPNRHTRLIRLRELRAALPGSLSVQTITLAPPLARSVGSLYGPLARLAPLRSHRLAICRG
jgi:SAM-dependent methyltransferase